MDYYLLSQLINGVIFGLIYALIALGLTIVFSIMRVVNFSHGEFYMLGGYTLYALTSGAVTFFSIPLSMPTIIGLPIAMVAVAIFAIVVERGLLRPVYTVRMDRPEEYAIILTFGLSLFLQYGALTAVGPYEMTPGAFWEGSKHILGDLYLAGDRLFATGVSVLLIAITIYFIYGTWTGRALMATAQNRVGSTVVGINTVRMNMIAMALAGLLAGAAGAAMAPIFLVYPDVGQIPVIKAFVIIVLGGMGSIPGAVVAAIILGIVESLGSVYLSVAYRDVFAFLVLIGVLLFRPHGLFGQKERRACPSLRKQLCHWQWSVDWPFHFYCTTSLTLSALRHPCCTSLFCHHPGTCCWVMQGSCPLHTRLSLESAPTPRDCSALDFLVRISVPA